MADIIQVLPDNIANQIAAGEVIQRPASVVKELVENSIDAGAKQVSVIVNDAGKSLIQIIDNGVGMSETDARLSFERHATSKIRKADDLFALTSFGFRGEALASIAAISQVELKTRRIDDILGTLIEINGSQVVRQEPVDCLKGTVISVRNIFFNVPARRKFLKSEQSEFNSIIDEFQRIALAHPSTALNLVHNGKNVYTLTSGNFKQRILGLFGANLISNILPIHVDTSVVKIEGFIGKPEAAKKTMRNNFFFVNNRYFAHRYFYRTVFNSYNNLIAPELKVPYFIKLTIDPAAIDVNIHPTKTEIKFENEVIIAKYLNSCIRETLGKKNMMPAIDFDNEPAFDISPPPKDYNFTTPKIEINPDFNPFKTTSPSFKSDNSFKKDRVPHDWERLYEGLETESKSEQTSLDLKDDSETNFLPNSLFFQLKGKYLLTSVKSGLIVIDQKRAHQRILFEQYLEKLGNSTAHTEVQLFSTTIDFNPDEAMLLKALLPKLQSIGFDVEEFGKNSFVIRGIPVGHEISKSESFIRDFINSYADSHSDIIKDEHERIAKSMADATAMPYLKVLSNKEMQHLFDNLFLCKNPSISPSGKNVFVILPIEEIDKRFK